MYTDSWEQKMPDYSTVSFWLNWAVFAAIAGFLLLTNRPFDWTGIRQALAFSAMFLAIGFGWGVLFGDVDWQTMLILNGGGAEEVCVAGGYAGLMYVAVVTPYVIVKQAIGTLVATRKTSGE